VVRALDALAYEGKAQTAAMAARYGSALYGWALKRGYSSAQGIVTANPRS
jgi:hypothetical protein